MTGLAVPDNIRGISLMVAGAAVLLLNDAVAKLLTESYPVWQVVSLRQIVALLPILLFVHYQTGWSTLRVRDLPGQLIRGDRKVLRARRSPERDHRVVFQKNMGR